jgi:Fe-S-cluster-containing dehydrogenase component
MKILYVSKNFTGEETDLRAIDPDEYVLMVDVDRCISCGSCQMACQAEHAQQAGSPGLARVIASGKQSAKNGFRLLNPPLSCRHCQTPCAYFNEYNFWTTCPDSRIAGRVVELCDFCASRLDKGFMPACATRCTMKCLYFNRAADVAFTLGEKRLRGMGDVDLS